MASTLLVRMMARTDQFRREMEAAQRQLRETAEAAQGASTAMVAVGVAAGIACGAAVQLAARLEQTQVAFTTLLGGAAAADTMLRDLQKFAAETPFEFPGLADAARQLIAFGVSAEETIPSLRRIGDISAGIGAPIGEIAEVYGKARVQGRLFGEDINQLTGRGIPVIGELAKQFGIAESGVRQLVESGQVHFKHLERAFISLTGEGGKFAGLMEAQSKTLAGLWSTLKDNVGLAATALGEIIIKSLNLKGAIKNMIDATDRIRTMFENLRDTIEAIGIRRTLEQMISPEIRLAIIGIAGAVAGALAPAFIIAANAIWGASLALVPFMIKGAAVALAAYVIYRAWADAGGGMMAVGVLMVRMVGAVVGVLGLIIPSLRAVSQSIYAYADSLAAASKATRTMGDLHAATAQVAKSGENAANAQESLGDATKSAAKAAGKSIMAFDQVHQLQEDMAGTGAAAAMAMAIPEMAMSDVTMPGPQVPDVAAVAGPLDELTKKWDAVTAAMERARPVLEGIGYIMAAILIPVFARYIGNLTLLAVTSTITAAKVVAAWVLKAAAAVASAATQVAAFVTLIGHWILLGVRATVEAAKVAAAWILQRVQALASLAAQLPAFAIIVAKWIWMAAVATARAAVMAAAWLIAMGPVGWVILAIGLVAAAVALNWDKVSTWTKEKWGAVSAYLVETWDKLKTWAGEKWEAIKTAIETPIRTVITWLETQWTAAGTWLGTQWDNIKIWAGEKWDGVKTAIETPIRTVITWLETQWNTISGTLGNIWEGIRTLAKDKWEGVRDIIRGVLNSIISLINRFIRFWNKIEIKVPLIVIPFVGTFGGWSVRVPQLPEIPQLAKGTNYVPQDMFAFLHRGEAVVPEKFNHPGNDSQDTDAIYQAVYAAVRDAIKVSRVEQGGQGQRQEVVLEIDGNKIGRAVLPSLIREGQRLGVQLAGV